MAISVVRVQGLTLRIVYQAEAHETHVSRLSIIDLCPKATSTHATASLPSFDLFIALFPYSRNLRRGWCDSMCCFRCIS